MQAHEPSGIADFDIAHYFRQNEGLSVDEGGELITQLTKHAIHDNYTFAVEWENISDIVI